MHDTDQRADRRDADRRTRIRRGVAIGRTAVTGWVLAAVLGLATVGTAVGAEPGVQGVLVAGTTEDAVGSAAAVGPLAVYGVGEALDPGVPLDSVTAASPSTAGVVVGPVAPATAAGAPATVAPAGPAAQLRQAAFTTGAPDQRARIAIETALAQRGLPYVWGGNGPTNGDAGFDCSGLTTFSYAAAGVRLPRTAHTQWGAGPHVPDGAVLQPGDLVFYGTSARVHHVGMYLGAGRMVNAPTFGKPVQVAFYRYRGDDYLGATRPAAAAGSLTTGVLPYVEPVPVPASPAQVQEQIFQAPTASVPAVLPQPGDPALPSEQESAAQAIAESDAEAVRTGRTATATSTATRIPAAPSTPVAGATTSSSAPVATTTSPAGATTSSSAPTSAPSSPTSSVAGSTTTATSTTSAPVASSPASSSPASSSPASSSPASSSPVEHATGSTTATTTLAAAATVTTKAGASRTATASTTTSKTAASAPTTTATSTSRTKTVTTSSATKTVSSTSASDDDGDDDEDGDADDAKETEEDSDSSDSDSDETSTSKKATKTQEPDDSDSSDSDSSDSSDSDSSDADSDD